MSGKRWSLVFGVLGVLAVGCAAEAGQNGAGVPAAVAAELALAPPVRGFQIQTLGMMIEPGEDIRFCEALQLPGGPQDVYYVGRIESAMTTRGEDLIVSVVALGSATESAMDIGARVPCTRAGEAFGEEISQIVATQHARDDQRYPEGVGQVFYGGQKLAVDYHYQNDGSQAVAAQVKLNFHTVDEAAVQRTARTATFDNLTIYTPPGGYSSHLAQCAFSQDVLVSELVRRTQRRGTDFSVWLYGGERDGELLWHSADPLDTRTELETPLWLSPGQGFRFECDYHNTTDLELRFGVNASDELCTLNATYWLPDEQTESLPQGCLLFEVDPDGIARR